MRKVRARAPVTHACGRSMKLANLWASGENSSPVFTRSAENATCTQAYMAASTQTIWSGRGAPLTALTMETACLMRVGGVAVVAVVAVVAAVAEVMACL